MKRKLLGLSQRYVAALRKHLNSGRRVAPSSSAAALSVGCEAVALGLETLELAQMHERALITLELSPSKPGPLKRAEVFFTEANTPIEETHRAARQAKVHMSRVQETLGPRTVEQAATPRQWQRGGAHRKVIEHAAEKSGQHHHKCLAESLLLQKLLRQLTHRALTAQEDGRTKLSHKLQDEIAQTLIGINVRLLSLKQNSQQNIRALKNEIASAQRLVLKSAQSVRRFARELDSSVTAAKPSIRKFF